MAEPINVSSHHHANPDSPQAADAWIVGVIHKATQGLTSKDRCTVPIVRMRWMLDAGLLSGAYHIEHGKDGAVRVDFFLSTLALETGGALECCVLRADSVRSIHEPSIMEA